MHAWPRILILVLLAAIVGVPLALRPGDEAGGSPSSADGDAAARLVIITPHNEQIRYEFARAFNEWRAAQGLTAVAFDWRTSGGTSDLRKLVLAELADKYKRAWAENREPESMGYDLFFGGGDYEHNVLANGVTLSRDGESVRIPASERIELPDGMLESVFPQASIGGERLYQADLRWVGTALSSFGIVYNRDVLKMLDLREPYTWSDLQDVRYRGWLGLADPAHSGSIAMTYNVILRRVGWTEGWAMLRRIFANARSFAAGASKVPVDVSAGESAAGMCIDFYGRFQAGAIAAGRNGVPDRGGAPRVGYIDPMFMTAVTADPISILHLAPHRELAQQFVQWLLSAEAQQLWQARLNTPNGPTRFELRRLPVRRDTYTTQRMTAWTDRVNPFAIAKPFPEPMPNFYRTVYPVAHAMAIDIHDDLAAAWNAIVDNPNHPRHSQMVALFDAMPDDLTLTWPDANLAANWTTIIAQPNHPRYQQAAATLAAFAQSLEPTLTDSDKLLEARLRWTQFFREHYRRIVAMAQSD